MSLDENPITKALLLPSRKSLKSLAPKKNLFWISVMQSLLYGAQNQLSKRNVLWWNVFGTDGERSTQRKPENGHFTLACFEVIWRQIWRVTGRESGSPELLGSPRTSPEVPRTSPEVFGDFHRSSLTVELNSNQEVPRNFPEVSRTSPEVPRTSPEVSRFSGKPDTLFWLTKTFSELFKTTRRLK